MRALKKNFIFLAGCLAIAMLLFVVAGCQTSDDAVELDENGNPIKKELPFKHLQARKAGLMDDTPLKVSEYSNTEEPKMERPVTVMPDRLSSREDKNLNETEFPSTLIKGVTDPETLIDVNLVFDATDIGEVVAAFADEALLNFGYLLDPGVKGNVSMSVKSQITAKECWATFEHILWLCGAYASKNPGFVHILPFDKMPKERRIFVDHEIQPNVVVDFITIKYKKSAEVSTIIKPFMTDGATITDIPDSNSLLIVEAPANIVKLREIIKRVDSKGEREWPVKCFSCHEVEADVLSEELNSLLPVLGLPVATGTGASGGAIKLTPLPRIGSIVVSAALPEVVDEVGNWIKSLDRSDMLDKDEIYFYNVKHSTVEKLTASLEAFFNATTSASPSTSGTGSSSRYSTTSGSYRRGRESREKAKENAKNNTSNSTTTASSSKNSSNNRNNDDSEKSGSITQGIFETAVTVFSDDENNRLTIKTTPRTWGLVKIFLERQDVPPRQVSIRAIITDITLTNSTQFGITYAAQRLITGNGHGEDEFVLSGVTAGAGALEIMSNDPALLEENITQTMSNWSAGLGLIIRKGTDPLALIQAIAGEGNTRILSEPQVVVRSGAEAYLQAGKSVAIATQTTNYTSSSDNYSSNYEYEDIGVIMTVTPYVTAGNDVRMIIEQEVSDKAANSDYQSTPDITRKRVTTELIAPDNSTILMGGMIKSNELTNYSGIPYLKDIPYLGVLFRKNNIVTERTELLILLSVNVIDSDNPQEELVRRYKASLEEIEKRHTAENMY